MKLFQLTIFASLFSCAAASAQIYSDKDLLIIGGVNTALNTFLEKQGFPKSLKRESAIEFAEKQQLLRDGRLYTTTGNACKNNGFSSVDVGNDYSAPEIKKTIVSSQEDVRMDKAEYQNEWDKVIRKFGKPRYTEVSREIFPSNRSGMIDFINYRINYNGAPVFVRFELTSSGCLTAKVSYILENDARRWIDEAVKKQNPKSVIGNALE